eukprot:scaffold6813_cov123-Isochrysis_galbana.AAC.12
MAQDPPDLGTPVPNPTPPTLPLAPHSPTDLCFSCLPRAPASGSFSCSEPSNGFSCAEPVGDFNYGETATGSRDNAASGSDEKDGCTTEDCSTEAIDA